MELRRTDRDDVSGGSLGVGPGVIWRESRRGVRQAGWKGGKGMLDWWVNQCSILSCGVEV